MIAAKMKVQSLNIDSKGSRTINTNLRKRKIIVTKNLRAPDGNSSKTLSSGDAYC